MEVHSVLIILDCGRFKSCLQIHCQSTTTTPIYSARRATNNILEQLIMNDDLLHRINTT